MSSCASVKLPERKFSQLEPFGNSIEGYAYYCGLCDEILALSRQLIEPRRIRLVFDEACPCCGFELGSVLRCEASRIPLGTSVRMNPKCRNAHYLIDPSNEFHLRLSRGNALLQDSQSKLTTGIDLFDRTLVLGFGQLVVLQGAASNHLSHLLCVRAVLPHPLGPETDVVFIDGGNDFDPYTLSQRSIEHDLDPERMLGRIHLSRAFTYHQLSSLIMEKLPYAIEKYSAKLAVISDITELYCDADIQQEDRQEALDIFTKTLRFLAALAEQKHALIIATNPRSRNTRMDNILLQTAHVSTKLEERAAFVQVTVMRHPWIPQLKAPVAAVLDNETLETYT